MSISRDKQLSGIAQEVWFDKDKIYVRLADGREIAVPLTRISRNQTLPRDFLSILRKCSEVRA